MSHEKRIRDYMRYIKKMGAWRMQHKTEAQEREKDFLQYKRDNKKGG